MSSDTQRLAEVGEQHHFCVPIHIDLTQRAGQSVFILTSQYCQGGSLDALLSVSSQAKKIQQARVIGWATALLEAIAALHSKVQRLHLDIKPENLFLNDKKEIKLGDLGNSQVYITRVYTEEPWAGPQQSLHNIPLPIYSRQAV